MPKNKLEDVVFTAIMATVMVYGMIVYNVALNTGKVDGTTFLAATHELIFMAPIAFILEFFIVGKIAAKLAFTVMKPTDKPQFITYAILLHYVPYNEPYCYLPFQNTVIRYMGTDLGT